MKNNFGTLKVFSDANTAISKKSDYLNKVFSSLAQTQPAKGKKEVEVKPHKNAA